LIGSVEIIPPPSEGLSPPFLSLFMLTFDVGGDGGGSGDIFRMMDIIIQEKAGP
jgi:hypothetical protein